MYIARKHHLYVEFPLISIPFNRSQSSHEYVMRHGGRGLVELKRQGRIPVVLLLYLSLLMIVIVEHTQCIMLIRPHIHTRAPSLVFTIPFNAITHNLCVANLFLISKNS